MNRLRHIHIRSYCVAALCRTSRALSILTITDVLVMHDGRLPVHRSRLVPPRGGQVRATFFDCAMTLGIFASKVCAKSGVVAIAAKRDARIHLLSGGTKSRVIGYVSFATTSSPHESSNCNIRERQIATLSGIATPSYATAGKETACLPLMRLIGPTFAPHKI